MRLPSLEVAVLSHPPMDQPGHNRTDSKFVKPSTPSTADIIATICKQNYAHPVRSVEKVSTDAQQTYLITCSQGSRALLKLPTTGAVRLLRQERDSLAVEAYTLRVMSPVLNTSMPSLMAYVPASSASPALSLVDQGIGIPLIKLGDLAPTDVRTIEASLESWPRTLSPLRGPAFGLMYSVIHGSDDGTWRRAFLRMVETLLHDGEDMLVNLPYDRIRTFAAKYGTVLDAIVEPRLLFLDGCRRDNLMIDPVTKEVTGLLDYSNAVWGDPEMAGCGGGPMYIRVSGSEGKATAPDGVARRLL